MKQNEFINRRREYRLPYFEKVIFSNGDKHLTAHALNISRGGVFLTTLDAFPIDTNGQLAFMLSSHSRSLCVKTRVTHIVFDQQRGEVECGMGLQFLDPTQAQLNLINLHIFSDQNNYLELRDLLNEEKLDWVNINKVRSRLPGLAQYDLLGLKYRVNRICTLFDPSILSNSSTAA
jgi:Tfp pilus assembly protein PilZ